MQVAAQRQGDRLTTQVCAGGTHPHFPCSLNNRCIDAIPVQSQQETLSLWRESEAAAILSDVYRAEKTVSFSKSDEALQCYSR